MFNSEKDAPLPENAKPGEGIHHPNFGRALKEKMDPLKIECIVRHAGEEGPGLKEVVEFFARHLKGRDGK